MVAGYLLPACGPNEYRWAIDRLVEEFGHLAVRVGWETDHGRTRQIAVSPSGWKDGHLLVWTLYGRHPNDQSCWYDLNDNRSDMDKFIERARSAVRGFGT